MISFRWTQIPKAAVQQRAVERTIRTFYTDSNYATVSIIVGILLAEKVSTKATWWNILKSEFWEIILVISVGLIASAIIKYYKSNK